MKEDHNYLKLPEKTKKLWVDALRDPNTKQGYGQLENCLGERCCLGVLAKAMGVEISPEDESCFQKTFLFSNGNSPHQTSIPNLTRIEWGFDKEAMSKLMEFNDSFRVNFFYIAKWIEENL